MPTTVGGVRRGCAAKKQSGWTEPRWWRDEPFNHATQSVVGISWYEAEAYCKWLTAHWRGSGVIGQQERVRLPTQEEWMAAARGRRPAPSDESIDYPWHGPFDPAFANTEESKLEQTSPVHLYPQGVTVDGVWDMAGNVWEWTNDEAQRDKDGGAWYYRKGGSWFDNANHARISAAVAGRIRYFHPGFRVVVVPVSCSGAG